jgi:predicted membrane channel-forming protein YqfA (hemolysin III family)
MIGLLLPFFAIGLVTLLVASVVLGIIGVVFSLTFGLATFLLFKVTPILLVGWVVVKMFEKSRGKGSLSDADRRWLDGGSDTT